MEPKRPKTVECAVLFADIADSTGLYNRYGDARAQDVVVRCLERMGQICVHHEGTVIKTVGDEIMCRFPSAEMAVRAAIRFHAAMEEEVVAEVEPVSVRIGLHFGEVIEDQADIFGDAVNLAARMTEIAKARQIITTEDTVEKLPVEIAHLVRRYDQVAVRGRDLPVTVYEIVCDQADATSILTGANLAEFLGSLRLQLSFKDKEFVLSPESKVLCMGRGTGCDVVVNSLLVSRVHSKIEYRRGKFVITDESTNGTYVHTQDGNEVYLRREALPLWGEGSISLGQSVKDNEDMLIRYSCD